MVLGICILLACLIVGVRYGSLGLPVISGIGLIIYVFALGYKPGTPPIAVMLTIIAVVTCAGYLQTSGGLTVMLKYASGSCAATRSVSRFTRRSRHGC